MVSDDYARDSSVFFNTFKSQFEEEHFEDLRSLERVSLPEHVASDSTAKIYRENKYRVSLSSTAFQILIQFLESKEKEGGASLVGIIQTHLNINTLNRANDSQSALAQILNRTKTVDDFPAEDEGIPGHNPGSANTTRSAGDNVLTRLRLGALPLDQELKDDVLADLQDEDVKDPPALGQPTLVAQFEDRIKREESEEGPNRSELQLPPSTARDVAMEVQKVKEDRDRFKIESRTGGVGPAISVTMFTFHNTMDRLGA